MWSSISAFILKLFSSSALGILISKLLKSTGKTIVDEILDKDNQQKAYLFVKELNENKELSNIEKAKLFNEKMVKWVASVGKKALSESVINCLRELAVNAVKADSDSENTEQT